MIKVKSKLGYQQINSVLTNVTMIFNVNFVISKLYRSHRYQSDP